MHSMSPASSSSRISPINRDRDRDRVHQHDLDDADELLDDCRMALSNDRLVWRTRRALTMKIWCSSDDQHRSCANDFWMRLIRPCPTNDAVRVTVLDSCTLAAAEETTFAIPHRDVS